MEPCTAAQVVMRHEAITARLEPAVTATKAITKPKATSWHSAGVRHDV
jgi:hypothetical protein